MPTTCHANHVINLNFATGADAQTALNASIQIHAHRNMAVIQQWDAISLKRWKTAFFNLICIGHIPKMRCTIMGNIAFGLIRHQQFNNHTARLF